MCLKRYPPTNSNDIKINNLFAISNIITDLLRNWIKLTVFRVVLGEIFHLPAPTRTSKRIHFRQRQDPKTNREVNWWGKILSLCQVTDLHFPQISSKTRVFRLTTTRIAFMTWTNKIWAVWIHLYTIWICTKIIRSKEFSRQTNHPFCSTHPSCSAIGTPALMNSSKCSLEEAPQIHERMKVEEFWPQQTICSKISTQMLSIVPIKALCR